MSYLKLFRWPNLLVVALTQILVRYAIILPELQLQGIQPGLEHADFIILVLVTMAITAAGYAINDYFDLRADRINKPAKTVLGKSIPRQKAILYHTLLNIAAVTAGIYLSLKVGEWSLALIFVVVPVLLWLYSVRYKKVFFAGNFIVATLASFVIAIVWIFEYQALDNGVTDASVMLISYITRVYALFAFLTTLVREIIKDVEDIEGDKLTGCRTIPVVTGINATRRLVVFLTTGTMAFIFYMLVYLWRNDYQILFFYILLAVLMPFAYMLYKIINASEKKHYTYLSGLAKIIMVAGVLSMALINA